jgi:purine nucleosidase
MPRTIVLDCDPGHDDAIAMMLAHAHPEIDLAAVTTVAGNQTLQKVTRNALAVATICRMTGVPIAAGAAHPLVRPVRIAPDIHGESGMDGPVLPEPAVPLDDRHGVDLIIDTVLTRPAGSVTLVPTGPLTNIALAARKAPQIVDRVAGVVLMGGGHAGGNTTAAAEFNILADPEAAHVVFSAPWPVTQVGLDLTHQATATPDVVARIAEIDNPAARFVVDLLEFFGQTYRVAQGFDAPPVHDPCAVALLADPAVIVTRPAHVDVELTGTHTLGMTVTDFAGRGGIALDHRVAVTLDRDRFWDMVVAALAAIGPAPTPRHGPTPLRMDQLRPHE